MLTFVRAALAIGFAAIVPATLAADAGENAPPEFVMDGGGITALASADGTIFAGGSFLHVGPPSAPFVVFRGANTSPDTSVAAPDNGAVAGIASDGDGGWFVGGSFTSFGGVPCPHLVHVLPGGAVDDSWCPHADVVSNLVREGRVIYAIVPTPSIDGPGRQLAGFNAQTAARVPWHVPLGTSRVPMIMPSNVWTLVATPTRVYLGGGFASVDGHKAIRLAAIDARTGRFVWAAKAAGGPVNTLALDGGRLYAQGSFYIVNGEPRDGFAVLDAATGRLSSWEPRDTTIRHVVGMAVSSGTVYLASAHDRSGEPTTLTAIAASTGATRWERTSTAYPLAVDGGDLLVSEHRLLTALDAATGAGRRWSIATDLTASWEQSETSAFSPSGTRGADYASAVFATSGTALALGGSFRSIGPFVPRAGLAAVDASTAALSSWRADITGDRFGNVGALDAAGDSLFVAGDFATLGGMPRAGLGAVDIRTGATTPWRPPATLDCVVGDCTVDAGGRGVYVATQAGFRVDGRARRVAGFDPVTAAPLPWNPAPDDDVWALAADDSTVFLGGAFAHIRGADRPSLAAVDAVTGAPTAWRPAPDGRIWTLMLQGTTLFVGGDFTTIAGAPRLGLAAFDTVTGALLPWDPGAWLKPAQVDAVADDGGVIYVLARLDKTMQVVGVDAETGAKRSSAVAPKDAKDIAVADDHVYVSTGAVLTPAPEG